MPRYIDAEHFSERFDMMCDAGGVLASVTEAVREMVKELINAEPTADVQEVKHGHWILEKHLDLDILICSNCGCDRNCTKYGQYYMKHDKYCPNCGAKNAG